MKNDATAYFGGGCFWCTEAIFSNLKGVSSVMSGYAGGEMDNPSYQDVSSGKTGHAEVIKITYDPNLISYGKLLEVFFATHDPTTLNRQGADIGSQYRSLVFYTDKEQKKEAVSYVEKLKKNKVFQDDIVTEIKPFVKFFPAEDYHRNYYQKNSQNLYCRLVINPKLNKLNKEFPDNVK